MKAIDRYRIALQIIAGRNHQGCKYDHGSTLHDVMHITIFAKLVLDGQEPEKALEGA